MLVRLKNDRFGKIGLSLVTRVETGNSHLVFLFFEKKRTHSSWFVTTGVYSEQSLFKGLWVNAWAGALRVEGIPPPCHAESPWIPQVIQMNLSTGEWTFRVITVKIASGLSSHGRVAGSTYTSTTGSDAGNWTGSHLMTEPPTPDNFDAAPKWTGGRPSWRVPLPFACLALCFCRRLGCWFVVIGWLILCPTYSVKLLHL